MIHRKFLGFLDLSWTGPCRGLTLLAWFFFVLSGSESLIGLNAANFVRILLLNFLIRLRKQWAVKRWKQVRTNAGQGDRIFKSLFYLTFYKLNQLCSRHTEYMALWFISSKTANKNEKLLRKILCFACWLNQGCVLLWCTGFQWLIYLFIYLFIYFNICIYEVYTGVRTKGHNIPYQVQPP